MNDWKEELVTILPPEHATLEVHNILFEFISRTLSLHDKKLAETIRAEKLKPQSLSELYAPEEINIWNKALELAAQVIEGKEGV